MQIQYNRTARKQQPIYIVIHDTGNKGVGANAKSHFNYWNGADRQSSADFVVDDTQALQLNDYTLYYTWHCGDGGGKYGISNANSIGVEICINADGDYNKAYENAVQLVKTLMRDNGIDISHVVRHYDASRKNCPASMSADGWELWYQFKDKVMEASELTAVNDIVWELAEKGIITEKDKWIAKLDQDEDVYWLARKAANYIREL